MFFGIGVGHLLEKILHLPAWLILLLVFLLPGLEASIFLGVFFPGEIAVLLGGVAASQGSVPIALVVIAACLGAVLGDQVGYVVGREWGEQVLRKIPDRLLDEDRLQKGRAYIRRMGAKGVILGRWTAALRALVPGPGGHVAHAYPRFLIANVIGGVGWATLGRGRRLPGGKQLQEGRVGARQRVVRAARADRRRVHRRGTSCAQRREQASARIDRSRAVENSRTGRWPG